MSWITTVSPLSPTVELLLPAANSGVSGNSAREGAPTYASFCREGATALPPHERIRQGLRRTYQSSLLFRELTVRDNLFLAVRGVAWRGLRTRRAGSDAWIDVVVLVPGEWTVDAGHAVADEVEAAFVAIVPKATVVTHLEPIPR